ncbi:hypothetical protein [Aquamicrobium sp. LC103]|uniref:hypothetical protein n=1 Tax=Aquamicrobium sp. LC103 TaxID=1120658 RepID=UPI0032B16FBC
MQTAQFDAKASGDGKRPDPMGSGRIGGNFGDGNFDRVPADGVCLVREQIDMRLQEAACSEL